jgi:hypothetical protein
MWHLISECAIDRKVKLHNDRPPPVIHLFSELRSKTSTARPSASKRRDGAYYASLRRGRLSLFNIL